MSRSLKPVGVLKRKADQSTDLDMCMICQENKNIALIKKPTETAKQKVKECFYMRRKFHDEENRLTLDRLEKVIDTPLWEKEGLRWHKNCYSSFTSTNNIAHIEKRFKDKHASPTIELVCEDQSTSKLRRQSVIQLDWNKCMFCQTVIKDKLIRVESFSRSNDILSRAEIDDLMRVHLSGISDLMAAEGKYHNKCLNDFKRRTDKYKSEDSANIDPAFANLCTQLEDGLGRGHVFDMGDVWKTYTEFARNIYSEIPPRYLSRRQTFYSDIESRLGTKAKFVRPLNRGMSLVMYPGDSSEYVISHSLSREPGSDIFASSSESESEESSHETDNEQNKFMQDTSLLQEMIHVTLQIRSDLERYPGHETNLENITKQSVEKIIPNSFYLFLVLLFGGMPAVEGIMSSETYESESNNIGRILSVAQDIVYGVSKGSKLTPKHIGLGLTLHQATRSEVLVNLFHAANHCIPIHTIREFDNIIANRVLKRYQENGYVFVPPSIKPDTFTHFSCDNIDVLECTLDGKNTFHSTQVMAWQSSSKEAPEEPHSKETPEDPNANESVSNKPISKELMSIYQTVEQSNMSASKRVQPPDVYKDIDMKIWTIDISKVADGELLAWLLARQKPSHQQSIPLWAAFNEAKSKPNHDVTRPGMLPILCAPADEYDTIISIINRFEGISNHVGQTFTVITSDQPLYSKGIEIVWANRERYKNVKFMMGGLHICFNFLRAIGQHMECSGLEDVFVEASVFGPNAVTKALEGKAYYRAVRGHLLAYEAIWRLKWRYFKDWLQSRTQTELELESEISELEAAFVERRKGQHDEITKANANLLNAICVGKLGELLSEFDAEKSRMKNYAFWNSYLHLVDLLLKFIKAQRTGDWKLHIEAFSEMLPWLMVYDHTNYARWGPVYLADIKGLEQSASEVYDEFMNGHFVVRLKEKGFNGVPVDHATEWINRMCKTAGGIIGITRQDQARDRFCITWSIRSDVSNSTMKLFNQQQDDEEDTGIYTRPDATQSRINADEHKINEMMKLFSTLDVFGMRCPEGNLFSIASKDVATDEVCNDLLTCENRGQSLLEDFAKCRLKDKSIGFYAPIKKVNSKTFAFLYKETVTETQKATKLLKADRKLMQRLFNAANSGRDVETASVLEHELYDVPLSLAKPSGLMHETQKSHMLKVLTSDIGIATPLTPPGEKDYTCVIIDGHALIQTIGKPKECETFGQYVSVFTDLVFKHFGSKTTRVDVTFDRYFGDKSIKSATRAKRKGKRRPIRKLITGPEIKLPQIWEQYITHDENKADLAEFLSSELLKKSDDLPPGSMLVIGGGFPGENNSQSSGFDASNLCVNHEEADTRMVLHARDAIHRGYKRVEIYCRDTDVLLLLIHHLGTDAEVWMLSGSGKNRKCYPVHTISSRLDDSVRKNILGFPAVTGCDTTSSLNGISKKASWMKYIECPDTLESVGRDGDMLQVSRFLCMLYGCGQDHEPNINVCRYRSFRKARKSLELLPPTNDALELHLKRANYQANIWLNACNQHFQPGDPLDTGAWTLDNDKLKPVWMRKSQVPTACIQLVSCGCKTKCSTARCKCYRSGQGCLFECACEASGCLNPM